MKKRILSCLMALALCLTLLPTAALAEGGHQDHCLCGKTHNSNITTHKADDLTAFANAKWMASYTGQLGVEKSSTSSSGKLLDEDGDYVILTTGYYYLSTTADNGDHSYVKSYKPIKIQGDVTICLNGNQIQKAGSTTGPVFEVPSDCTLTLTDCKVTGQIVCNDSSNGSGVYVNGGTLNLYSGQITQSYGQKGTDSNKYGGGVYVGSGGTFNMYGGDITGNSANFGGGVYVERNGTFNMYDGTITGNNADIGGGVYVETSGKFIMKNTASVKNNTIGYGSTGGAGVYVNGGTFEMYDTASVTNNTVNNINGSSGGGVYVNGGTFEMHNSASVTGNKATNGTLNGGGVYVNGSGTFAMNNSASVSGNTANQGGGVYVESGTFNMNDGKISGNKAKNDKASNDTNGGGVFVNKSGTFNMNDGAISDNKATNSDESNTTYGGGVYVSGGTFTMNGWASSVSKNTAKNGGGVSVSSGTFNMNDGKISGNTGNGVFVHNDATFTVSKTPTVTGNMNTTNSAASNVYLMGSAYITIGKDGLTGDEGSIGVTKLPNSGKEEIVIAEGVNEDCSSKFSSDDETREVKYENKQLVLKKKATQPSEHTHSYNENTWGKNATHHWHECTASDCTDKTGSIKDKAEHVYENNTDTTCNVCGYVRTVTTNPILVTKITLSPASPKLKVGQTQAMTVVIEPQTATKKDVTWKSSKPEVATVANDGTVTAHKAGTAEITATAEDDSKVSATCKVTVTDDTTTGGGTTPSQPGGSTGGSSGGSSSGGGGGSSSTTPTKPETATKPDGTKVETVTKPDGTKVETTTGKDGSVTKTETKTETKPDGTKAETKSETVINKDGSKVESETRTETKKDGTVTESKAETITSKDGTKSETKSETKTDKNGETSGTETTKTTTANGSTGMTVTTIENGESKTAAEAKVSSKAVEDAKKNGEAVKAPVEVEASRNSNTAPTVKVELPKGTGETKVEIPVSNVKPGTVAVLVHPDGTEEILKDSIPTENGIRLTVDGNATVKIVDNSKDFVDTRNHWAEDAIDFVSARGLVNGVSDTIYAPNASATRAQLWTILARQNDADLNSGNTWYEKAQNWAKDKGVSDGANPNAAINRAQMVTMLWRTMGQPTATDKVSFADVPAGSYYAQAVAWAVESGITAGVGGGRFDPSATCTRAQIAAFLARSMK